MVPKATTPVGRVGTNGHGRGAIRFARLALGLMAAAAPARCGAFVDERRIVVGDGGGRARTRNAHPAQLGQCGFRSGCWLVVLGFGLRASTVAWPPTA